MLFLFNDVVFDMGDVISLLRDGEIPIPPSEFDKLTTDDLTSLVRQAVFDDPDVARNRPSQTQHLCALISYRAPGANALLAVRYDGAETPLDVGLRFANVPITTLAYLWQMQAEETLTANEINTEVWARVTGTLHTGT